MLKYKQLENKRGWNFSYTTVIETHHVDNWFSIVTSQKRPPGKLIDQVNFILFTTVRENTNFTES